MQTVYIETTVLSYLTSRPSRDLLVAAHQQVTVDWWENWLPLFEPFISPLVIEEVSRGDEIAARLRLEKIAGLSVLKITEGYADLPTFISKQYRFQRKQGAMPITLQWRLSMVWTSW